MYVCTYLLHRKNQETNHDVKIIYILLIMTLVRDFYIHCFFLFVVLDHHLQGLLQLHPKAELIMATEEPA